MFHTALPYGKVCDSEQCSRSHSFMGKSARRPYADPIRLLRISADHLDRLRPAF